MANENKIKQKQKTQNTDFLHTITFFIGSVDSHLKLSKLNERAQQLVFFDEKKKATFEKYTIAFVHQASEKQNNTLRIKGNDVNNFVN